MDLNVNFFTITVMEAAGTLRFFPPFLSDTDHPEYRNGSFPCIESPPLSSQLFLLASSEV